MAEAPPGARERPLSPHIWIWRWHVTMATSILHRATGVALYVGALVLAGWALALASGPEAYSDYMTVLGSIPGKVVLFAMTVAVFYHLGNGVRHLVWDAGRGLDVKSADASGWAVLAFGLFGAVFFWAFAILTGAI